MKMRISNRPYYSHETQVLPCGHCEHCGFWRRGRRPPADAIVYTSPSPPHPRIHKCQNQPKKVLHKSIQSGSAFPQKIILYNCLIASSKRYLTILIKLVKIRLDWVIWHAKNERSSMNRPRIFPKILKQSGHISKHVNSSNFLSL